MNKQARKLKRQKEAEEQVKILNDKINNAVSKSERRRLEVMLNAAKEKKGA